MPATLSRGPGCAFLPYLTEGHAASSCGPGGRTWRDRHGEARRGAPAVLSGARHGNFSRIRRSFAPPPGDRSCGSGQGGQFRHDRSPEYCDRFWRLHLHLLLFGLAHFRRQSDRLADGGQQLLRIEFNDHICGGNGTPPEPASLHYVHLVPSRWADCQYDDRLYPILFHAGVDGEDSRYWGELHCRLHALVFRSFSSPGRAFQELAIRGRIALLPNENLTAERPTFV